VRTTITITLQLSPETQQRLEALANENGQDIETVASRLIEIGMRSGMLIDESDILPVPHATIRDRIHLEELLLAGLASSKSEMTEHDWIDIDEAVEARLQECACCQYRDFETI
jgi:hypothetical protein